MPIATKKAVAKKVVRKVAVKKVAVKKAVAKKSTEGKQLVYADNTESFWTHDGQILNNLKALHDTLTSMDTVIYAYHVTKDNHHFADWVEIVLQDAACAHDLRKAKTPTSATIAVAKHLKTYHA